MMRTRGLLLIPILFLLLGVAVAQTPDPDKGGPELITDPAGSPILKYPVGHQHAASGCGGYLYISKDRIKYESKDQPAHSFDFARSDLTVAQQWHFLATNMPEAEFKFRNGTTWHFFHLRRRAVENEATLKKLGWSEVVAWEDLVNGATRFNDVVATLQAQQKAKEPPALSMIEPADAAVEGKTLMATGNTLRMRGIASHQSGIAMVYVNGQPAMLRQMTPQTSEFTADSVPVGSGTSAVVVVVTGGDKSESHKTFTVQRRGVRMLEPAYFPYETGESSVHLRGVAAGFSDVQRVEINGSAAVLARSDTGDFEFRAETPLNVGDNNLQGYVVAGDGLREPFSLAVKRLPPAGPQPLGEKEILKALEDGLPQTRIIALVNKYGVDFALNDTVEQRLRHAGADDALLLAIAKAKK